VFRHALVREAAYASLPLELTRESHRLAARWLIGAGEKEAATLAEHLESAGLPREAVPYYTLAAAEALRAFGTALPIPPRSSMQTTVLGQPSIWRALPSR
jgi:hypothetical protein